LKKPFITHISAGLPILEHVIRINKGDIHA
jgi:hypothetical protein